MPMAVLLADLASRGIAVASHSSDHVQVDYSTIPSSAGAPARAYSGPVACHATSDGATFMSVVASGTLRVPEQLRRRAAEVLAAVNSALPPGAGVFEIDAADGEVRCRVSRGLAVHAKGGDAALAAALVEGAWREALATAARQYDAVACIIALMLRDHPQDFARLDAAGAAALAAAVAEETAAAEASAARAAEAKAAAEAARYS